MEGQEFFSAPVMLDAILKHVPGMAAAPLVSMLDAAGLSEAEFRNTYVTHSHPRVIKGAVNHWTATANWAIPPI